MSFVTRTGFLQSLCVSVTCLIGSAATSGCTHQRHLSVPAANAPTRGITVSGVGKASGKPNVARFNVGIEARAGSAEQAMSEVNSRMALIIAAVKAAGVADTDVRTATLSLQFERSDEQPPRPVEPVAPRGPTPPKPEAPPAKAEPAAPPPKLPQGYYAASNNIEVTIRDLTRAGTVLSSATAAGANQLYGIRFELEDTSALVSEARKQAVADARARAERLAQLAGVRLGPPVSITEMDGGMPGHAPVFAMMKSEAAVPIESGELTVNSTVQIVYELAE